jgi:hypothetical protein
MKIIEELLNLNRLRKELENGGDSNFFTKFEDRLV